MTATRVRVSLSDSETRFDEMAEEVFEWQLLRSPIYGRYAAGARWTGWQSAPFLPVEAFKWDGIVDPAEAPDVVFFSSGTGGRPSRHPVVDATLYDESAAAGFVRAFGRGPFTFVAHLPSYARKSSSLVYMVDRLIDYFGTPESGFVDDYDALRVSLTNARHHERPLIVFGTAFGLLGALAVDMPALPEGSIVIETGGMKTFHREVGRQELHSQIAVGFGIPRNQVRSEYGMCELLSQCYTSGDEVFYPPPWLRFRVVDPDNPEVGVPAGRTGLLAVFDLANVNSVSAVLTSDLAVERNGGFELLGRADAAEIRGCNFLLDTEL